MDRAERFSYEVSEVPELCIQRERIWADMREACRMGHVDDPGPEPASVTARKMEREAWLTEIRALSVSLTLP